MLNLLDKLLGDWTALCWPPDVADKLYPSPAAIYGFAVELGQPEPLVDTYGHHGPRAVEAGRRFVESLEYEWLIAGDLVVCAARDGEDGWRVDVTLPRWRGDLEFAIRRKPAVLYVRALVGGRRIWRLYHN